MDSATSTVSQTFRIEPTVARLIDVHLDAGLQETDIAWHYDRDHLYGDQLAENYNNDPPFRGGGTTTGPLNENQHFMVWMRPTAAKTVRKLYGVIQRPIAAGVPFLLR